MAGKDPKKMSLIDRVRAEGFVPASSVAGTVEEQQEKARMNAAKRAAEERLARDPYALPPKQPEPDTDIISQGKGPEPMGSVEAFGRGVAQGSDILGVDIGPLATAAEAALKKTMGGEDFDTERLRAQARDAYARTSPDTKGAYETGQYLQMAPLAYAAPGLAAQAVEKTMRKTGLGMKAAAKQKARLDKSSELVDELNKQYGLTTEALQKNRELVRRADELEDVKHNLAPVKRLAADKMAKAKAAKSEAEDAAQAAYDKAMGKAKQASRDFVAKQQDIASQSAQEAREGVPAPKDLQEQLRKIDREARDIRRRAETFDLGRQGKIEAEERLAQIGKERRAIKARQAQEGVDPASTKELQEISARRSDVERGARKAAADDLAKAEGKAKEELIRSRAEAITRFSYDAAGIRRIEDDIASQIHRSQGLKNIAGRAFRSTENLAKISADRSKQLARELEDLYGAGGQRMVERAVKKAVDHSILNLHASMRHKVGAVAIATYYARDPLAYHLLRATERMAAQGKTRKAARAFARFYSGAEAASTAGGKAAEYAREKLKIGDFEEKITDERIAFMDEVMSDEKTARLVMEEVRKEAKRMADRERRREMDEARRFVRNEQHLAKERQRQEERSARVRAQRPFLR